uniref:Sushi domain-containing protein / SCR repeat-containing protein n=4 Tax=Toxoplasma gondii TaxID=5811 RepID=A0A0F7V482_TOXGV|nr:TPA: sushi domain-containing protein / SCR repeat-containing protein [Toxoplasma gondii VEG]
MKTPFGCVFFFCLIALWGFSAALRTSDIGVDALSVSSRAAANGSEGGVAQSEQERASDEQRNDSEAHDSVASSESSDAERKDDPPDNKSTSETPEAKLAGRDASNPPASSKSPTPSPAPTPAVSTSTTPAKSSADTSKDPKNKLSSARKEKRIGKKFKRHDEFLADAVIDKLDSMRSVQVSGALLRRIWKEHQRVGDDMRDLLREYILALERELYTQQAEVFGVEQLKMDDVIHHEHSSEARKREVELEMQALAEQHNFMKKLFGHIQANVEAKNTSALVNRIEELDKPIDIIDAIDKRSGSDVLHCLKVIGKSIRYMQESVKKFSRELKTLERLDAERPSGEAERIRETLGFVMDPLSGPLSSMDYESLSWIPSKGQALLHVDKAYHDRMQHDYDSFLMDNDDADFDHSHHYDPFDYNDPFDFDDEDDDDDDVPRKKRTHGHPEKQLHFKRNQGSWKHDFRLPWEKEEAHPWYKGSSKPSRAHSHRQSVSVYASPTEPVEDHEEDSSMNHEDSAVFPGLFFLELGSKRTVGTAADNTPYAKQKSFVQRAQHSVQDIREHRDVDREDGVEGEQPLSFLETRSSAEEGGGSDEMRSESEGQGSAANGTEGESDKAEEAGKTAGGSAEKDKDASEAEGAEEASSEKTDGQGGNDQPSESESAGGAATHGESSTPEEGEGSEKAEEKGGHDKPEENDSSEKAEEKGGHDKPEENDSSEKAEEKGGHDKPEENDSSEKAEEKGGHDKPEENDSSEKAEEKGGHDKPEENDSSEKAEEKGGHDKSEENDSSEKAEETGSHDKPEENDSSEKAEATSHTRSEDHPRCIEIMDPQECVKTKNCFHDDVYRQCFFNCTAIVEADKCKEHQNCRYETLLPKDACVNQGYQSVSLTKQAFEGIMRGCEEFRDKPSCDMMEKATQRLKESGTPVIYDCHWLSEGPEVSGEVLSDGTQPGDNEEKEVGKEEAAQTQGGRSICVNRLEAPTAEKLLWGTIIAEKERKLQELQISRNLTPDKVCVRPRELANAMLNPDKPFYALGDQVEVKCRPGASFMGISRVITCHEEGVFDPQVACIAKGTLSSQQQAFMKEVQDYADVVEAAPELAAAGLETGGALATASTQGVAVAAFALIGVSAIVKTF